MSEMFKNYDNLDKDYVPNNRHRPCFVDETDEIVIGGTVTHVFTTWFDIDELVDDFDITYKQSLNIILVKHKKDVRYTIENSLGKSQIYVDLTPEETKQFVKNRDTFAQIKFYLKNGKVIYGDINNIRIIDTLDNISLRHDN